MIEKNYEQIYNKIKNIGIDTLEKSNLLENIVKELLISQLIENIQMDEEESNLILNNFIEKNGLKNEKKFKEFLLQKNLSKNILHSKLIRSSKINKFFLKKFKSAAKQFFIQNKDSYNKVTYSLIRNSNAQLAQELYFQIDGKEANIYDLAAKYSEGDEKFSKGVVGPVPISQSHELIRQKIINSSEGELFEPFKIENWWIVLKLEKIFQSSFSDQIELKICRDLFEKSVLKTSMLIIKQIRFGSNSD